MVKRPEAKADVKADLKVRTTTAVVCMLAALVAMPHAQGRNAPRITPPKEQFGKSIGDDYFLVNWTQWVEYLQKMDRESDRMTVVEIGKTAEGRSQYTAIVTSPENHKRLAQFKEMNRRLALADGLTDDAGAAARPRRQDRRLDRRRPARERGARRGAAHRADLPAEQRDRCGNAADPRRRDRAADERQPRRHGARVELVHARARRAPPLDRRRAAAVPEVHRPRQQPRFLHDEPAGEREREPGDVPRVVSGHHVQPPSDRSRGRGAVRAAVPRSVQLPLRSADPARHRPGRRGDPHAAGRGREAGRRDAIGGELLDVVQRRDPDDVVFPQPDRHPHRDDRQPDADRRSRSCRRCSSGARTCPIRLRRSRGTSGSRSSTR